MKRILAFDFGASSGRAILGRLENGRIVCTEIHRFANDAVKLRGTLYWDFLRLFFEMKTGITKAVAAGGFDAICIDTWGVDFGLLNATGDLIQNPVHYRDTRTEKIADRVFSLVSREQLYARTGTQFSLINTLYQLMALKERDPELLGQAKTMLMMPDLFAYMLTGEIYEEETIASTSNLLDPVRRDWDYALIEKLGLPKEIFAPVKKAGEIYGYLSDELCAELGAPKVPVIAVASHDTASAVAATPAEAEDFVYISCGTWSLFGSEISAPIINDTACRYNFTNEGGFAGKTRFLKNITGLWLIQESRRQYQREGTEVGFDTLEKEARAAEPFRSLIDPDDPVFAPPGDIPGRIREYCRQKGSPVPETRGQVMRTIYESLAHKYRTSLAELCDVTGKKFPRIHMVGGGIRDTFLCSLAADACGVEVAAGPVEATAYGAVAVACKALGVLKDLKEIRQVVAASEPIIVYRPEHPEAWPGR